MQCLWVVVYGPPVVFKAKLTTLSNIYCLCVVIDCPLPGKINGPVQYVFFGNLNYHPYAHFLMPSFYLPVDCFYQAWSCREYIDQICPTLYYTPNNHESVVGYEFWIRLEMKKIMLKKKKKEMTKIKRIALGHLWSDLTYHTWRTVLFSILGIFKVFVLYFIKLAI